MSVFIVFGNEKKSMQMPVQISTLIAAHSTMWVGTENGVLLAFPFTSPSMVAEESGWELIKVRMEDVNKQNKHKLTMMLCLKSCCLNGVHNMHTKAFDLALSFCFSLYRLALFTNSLHTDLFFFPSCM